MSALREIGTAHKKCHSQLTEVVGERERLKAKVSRLEELVQDASKQTQRLADVEAETATLYKKAELVDDAVAELGDYKNKLNEKTEQLAALKKKAAESALKLKEKEEVRQHQPALNNHLRHWPKYEKNLTKREPTLTR